jgi:CDP-diacylglycerol---serine O-phosphatidyltransferase
MKHIPSLFTLLNLFFGCCAIVYTLQTGINAVTDEAGTQFIVMPEEIWMASLFIFLAAIVDFLDGFIARLFKATSELGKQLDSLADVVSFGVAPSLIIYQFLRLSYSGEPDSLDNSWWALAPAFILACAAAYRLGKFNIDTRQQYGFRGMPTPAVGMLVASFPLIYWDNQSLFEIFTNKWLWYGLILLLSWLMVSNLPLIALKFKDFNIRNNLPKLILLAIAIVSVVFFRWLAFPIIFVAYIIVSLAFKPNEPRLNIRTDKP